MPTPGKGETQKQFVSRCIPMVMEEGTAEDNKQAAAMCFQMWRDHNKKKEDELEQKAAEPEAAEVKMMHAGEMAMPGYYGGATSFADLRAAEEAEEYAEGVHELAGQFAMLAGNILNSPDVQDRAAALGALAGEFTALVQSPPEEKEVTSEPDEAGLFQRFKAWLTRDKPPEPETPGLRPGSGQGFMLWKEADGSYRWLARYSNNFRDQDSPPEIISSDSHRRFVHLVDNKEVDYPELWLWHRPEWRWGRATWLAYDDAGFALAAGTVSKEAEPLADHLMVLDPALVRVSHGMPTQSIVRDESDESVIVQHVTREISPLPAWAAANQRTGFIILKEQDMAIPQDKRDALQTEWNLSAELLSQLEAANAADAKEADEAGIESKEVETVPVEAPIETAPPSESPPATAPVTEPEASGVSRAEMAQALQSIGQAITALSEQIKELKGQVVEVQEQKSVEEAMTLSEIFQRAIGHPDTRVDGRTTAAKDRPAETKPDKPGIINTGNPLADNTISDIVSGKFLESLRGLQPPH